MKNQSSLIVYFSILICVIILNQACLLRAGPSRKTYREIVEVTAEIEGLMAEYVEACKNPDTKVLSDFWLDRNAFTRTRNAFTRTLDSTSLIGFENWKIQLDNTGEKGFCPLAIL